MSTSLWTHPRKSRRPTINPDYWYKLARQTLSLMRNKDRPIFLGEICQQARVSIETAEKILTDLIEQNLVQVLDGQSPSYTLVNPQDIPRGDWDTIPFHIFHNPMK